MKIRRLKASQIFVSVSPQKTCVRQDPQLWQLLLLRPQRTKNKKSGSASAIQSGGISGCMSRTADAPSTLAKSMQDQIHIPCIKGML